MVMTCTGWLSICKKRRPNTETGWCRLRRKPVAILPNLESPMKHEILEEVWRMREQIFAECGYELKKLVARMRRQEAKHADRLVSYAPGKPPAKAGKGVRHKGGNPPAKRVVANAAA
jgi:hypothetical protein